jgi:hypothetical protein
VVLVAGSDGLQPGAFVNAIHAAPALTAVRNLRRVNSLPIARVSLSRVLLKHLLS